MARYHTPAAATVERQLDEHIDEALESTRLLLLEKGATRAELEDAMEWQRQQWAAWRRRMMEVAKAAVADPAAGETKH
jgi:hypothetical protein